MNAYPLIDIVESAPDKVYVVHERFERRFRMHSHSKGQLSYVEDGIAYLLLENAQFVLPAKHFVWIPAHLPHELNVSHSATQLHSLYFPPIEKEPHPFYATFGIYPANELLIALIRFTERWHAQPVDAATPFYELLYGLYHLLSETDMKPLHLMLPFSEDSKIKRITGYIQQNFGKDLTISLMTQQFGMSERTFTRSFKKELGITFMQYLKSVRIMEAIALLLKTNLSVSEIANKVGYDSLPSFSRIFRSYTGKGPNEMRRGTNF